MAEEIKELIEKINKDGIEAAQVKAKEIEDQARRLAADIIEKAKNEAGMIVSQAKAQAGRIEEKERALLAQAGRDFLLSLRKEINAMLDRLVIAETRQVLTPEAMQRMLSELIKSTAGPKLDNIIIALKKEDADILEKGFLAKLKEETKKAITLKPAEDIRAGFTISFDNGKSCYDFSDKSLAEYIGRYLKPKLNDLLKAAL